MDVKASFHYDISASISIISRILLMLQSDWLSHCTLSAISVLWLELVYEMATFFRLAKVLEENFDKNG